MRRPGSAVRRWRRPRTVVLAAGLLVLLALVWAAVQASAAARDLRAARAHLVTARAAVSAGEPWTAHVERAAQRTRAARARLDGAVVDGLSAVPVLGTPLETSRAVAGAVDLVVQDAAAPLAAALGEEPLASLVPEAGRVDVSLLSSLAQPSARAAEALDRARSRLEQTSSDSRVPVVDRARDDLLEQVVRLEQAVDALVVAADVGPRLLGADRLRSYLVLSQSPAEARGTGGLIGGYTLLEAEGGVLRVVASGDKGDLQSPGTPVVDLGPEHSDHYGANGVTTGWINANLGPHVPDAGRVVQALWERQGGQPLDGVVLVDPVALSYVLTATGPVVLDDGTRVGSEQVVDLTLRDVYQRFPRFDQDRVRDAYLQQVSSGATRALLTGAVPARALLEAMTRAVREDRLRAWSADAEVQSVLEDTQLGGVLPRGRAVGDVVVDAAGSKLDYYLGRDLVYEPACSKALSRLRLRLTNGAPAAGLPEYVTPERHRRGGPPGTNVLLSTLYLPPGSSVGQLSLDGVPQSFRSGTERGLVWVEVLVTLLPGQSSDLVATFAEPPPADEDVARVSQPLVRPESFTVVPC